MTKKKVKISEVAEKPIPMTVEDLAEAMDQLIDTLQEKFDAVVEVLTIFQEQTIYLNKRLIKLEEKNAKSKGSKSLK